MMRDASREFMNKSICPLCGKPNDCYMENSKDPKDCWCKDVIIPKGIFALVPDEALNKACICKACILKFKESNESKEDHLTESIN
jgi:hypothetical protein